MLLLACTLGLATALACASVGGGFYEFSVVDPYWPRRPDLIQPERGGMSRRRFWIPAHVAFELTLVASLILAWSQPDVRFWLLIALASHVVMRFWSAFDFIPKALAFERAEPATFDQAGASLDLAQPTQDAARSGDMQRDVGRPCCCGASNLRFHSGAAASRLLIVATLSYTRSKVSGP